MINSLFALCILWFGNNRYELHYWWGQIIYTASFQSLMIILVILNLLYFCYTRIMTLSKKLNAVDELLSCDPLYLAKDDATISCVLAMLKCKDDATKQLDILQREIQDAHEDSKNLETVLKDLKKKFKNLAESKRKQRDNKQKR
ncbi:hypothetical protein NC653_038013 [Populus alba x Populus x berolinensis]|uniref:Uncharacterized protein n=1 Tax=Populus alba x Populus x berolinensis TaxID=444605 RepID=A0AAD6LFZ2_9ROSI|nr:hypothetical protein NC653_038013 [Populus alba x Populus x berolinensis]